MTVADNSLVGARSAKHSEKASAKIGQSPYRIRDESGNRQRRCHWFQFKVINTH